MGLGGVHNAAQVTGLRFLLGVMEAGLFPGFVYYLTFWYRNSERSMRVALILASATLAGAFGGAIAYAVGHMNGAQGLSAWRWLFIIEGAPSCASSVLVWFFLPDYPESAHWLNGEEKELAAERLRLEGSKGSASAMSWEDARGVLTDWRLYAHYAVCWVSKWKLDSRADGCNRCILAFRRRSPVFLSSRLLLPLDLGIRISVRN
jgi:MFS family permease